jgi:murein DD-endopeptidase MepM/ murein hydrolase activator NlpD
VKTYSTFDGGPVYADLNIGESAAISPRVQLLDIGYQGPVGKLGRAELGWVSVAVGDETADIPLGWWRTVGGMRISAELNAVYNTDPERKRWERDYWRLDHDARLMLSDAATPLTLAGRYAFPMVSDGWSWGYTHNWLSKYSNSMGLNPTHYGVDIDCPIGAGNVRAATGGEIVYVGGYKAPDEIGSAGIVVSIIGEDGLGYLYCHMGALDAAIREGARIPTRHPIGPSGFSGAENINATPHMHFEMHWGESPEALRLSLRPPWCDESHATLAFRVNPLPYLFHWFEEYLATEYE